MSIEDQNHLEQSHSDKKHSEEKYAEYSKCVVKKEINQDRNLASGTGVVDSSTNRIEDTERNSFQVNIEDTRTNPCKSQHTRDGASGTETGCGDKEDGNIEIDTQASKLHHQEDRGLPIDRGWAWVILTGSVLNVILMVGYARSIGVLFVEYLEIFEASAAKTTLFMGVMAAAFSISSLFSMNVLLQILGERKLVLLGGVLSVIGMLTAVFPTSITYLICTHSIIIGIGHSMIHGPGLVLIGQYFKKRRGLATAISMSGISLGGSVFPPIIRYFVDEYGVRGSMLILTGMTMNLFVGALLYRPLDSFRNNNVKYKVISEDKVVSGCSQNCSRDANKTNLPSDETTGPLLSTDVPEEEQSVALNGNPGKRIKSFSEHSSLVSKSQLQLYTSSPDLLSVSLMDLENGDNYADKSTLQQDEAKGICYYLKMVVVALDFSLFKNPMFQVIVATSNTAVVFGLVGLYLPALAAEKGIQPTEASLLLTICGTIDFFSRLTAGYIADLKRIKVHHLMALGLIVSGTASHFTSFYNSYALLIVYSVLCGLFGSVYHCLVPVYVVEFMGLDNMAKVLGFVSVFHGLSISVTHPIMGAIRDLTGSYNICFNYIGIFNYVGAVCLLCEPLARRKLRKMKAIQDQKETEEQDRLKE